MQESVSKRTPARLSGWKEIARHLGVSVRTAQLWEDTRGLPVRRLPGVRGGVYALTEELDAWAAGRAAELSHERRRQARERRMTRAALWVAGIALVAAAGLGGRFWASRSAGIASLRFEGNTVVASGAQGRELWRLTLEPMEPGTEVVKEQSYLMVADLDGDGRKEAVGGASCRGRNATGGEAVGATIFRISPEGQLLWKRPARPVLRGAGGDPFEGQWGLQAMAMAEGRVRVRVWVGLSHSIRYPGVVAEVMPDGGLREVFANYGHVNSLAAVRGEGKTWLLAGGASSALLGGFVAQIDPDKGLSIAPEGGPPRYRFTTRGQARPEVYYHLPLIDLTTAYLEDINAALAIQVTDSGKGWARFDVGDEGCRVYLEFDPPLRPKAVRISSQCELGHRKFEKTGVIGHPFERCPFLHESMLVRKWTEKGGWEEVRVPVANMHNTL